MFGEFPGLALSTSSTSSSSSPSKSSSSSSGGSSSSNDRSTKTSNKEDEKENTIFCHSTLDFTGLIVPLLYNPIEFEISEK